MVAELPNGIRLPHPWPPRTIGPGSDPLPVPYLAHPPAVLPIDTGRQLFVDDFLIEHTTLRRTYHAARLHPMAPVLWPQTALELNHGHCPVAAPFNDGAWYDAEDGLFKLWYQAGWFDGTALAISEDGLTWHRPDFDVIPGTNAVIRNPKAHRRDGALVWLDAEDEPAARYKMFIYWRGPDKPGGHVYRSPDGIHWQDLGATSRCGDNSSFFHNPFRGRWVFSIRESWNRRARSYHEHKDFVAASRWQEGAQVRWARTDRLDQPDRFLGLKTQLYDVNAVAYESILLGALAIFHGPENPDAAHLGRPKINDIQLAFSRDGFHWHRPHREAFIASSRHWGDWNYGYIHAAGGLCLVMDDELWFYFGAFSGQGSILKPGATGEFEQDNAMYAGGATGLATLRRDGFASLDAGPEPGLLATRLVRFSGSRLFVNVDCPHGELSVEVVDEHGEVIQPFTASLCHPVSGDNTKAEVVWKGRPDLSAVAGQPVQFRFRLRRGSLYSFWVSNSTDGRSGGYLAAGGPGHADRYDG